jgi:hypothetical protein
MRLKRCAGSCVHDRSSLLCGPPSKTAGRSKLPIPVRRFCSLTHTLWGVSERPYCVQTMSRRRSARCSPSLRCARKKSSIRPRVTCWTNRIGENLIAQIEAMDPSVTNLTLTTTLRLPRISATKPPPRALAPRGLDRPYQQMFCARLSFSGPLNADAVRYARESRTIRLPAPHSRHGTGSTTMVSDCS